MAVPLIATSARKQGIHDDDMLHALNHPMFVGADVAGNLLEIGVVDSADGPIIVHAMTARPRYLR